MLVSSSSHAFPPRDLSLGQERGMRATGLNTFGYRKQMKEWLDLSTQKQIPIALLIMSRAFVLKTTELNSKVYTAEESLKTSLTAFDDEVINEIIVQSADSNEDKNPEIKMRKLESIMHQNEVSPPPPSSSSSLTSLSYVFFFFDHSSSVKRSKKNLNQRRKLKRNQNQLKRAAAAPQLLQPVLPNLMIKLLLRLLLD
jgi:hypothetical protein